MCAHGSQWISNKINIRHPEQLKKWKSWEPFWSYQLNIYLKIGPNWPNRQCCLAGSSKMAPRILIFSIALGANHSFYVKSIETHARTFLPLNISAIGTVLRFLQSLPKMRKFSFDIEFFLTKNISHFHLLTPHDLK